MAAGIFGPEDHIELLDGEIVEMTGDHVTPLHAPGNSIAVADLLP